MEPAAPPPDTVEGWAVAFIRATDETAKLTPPAPPAAWEAAPPPRRLAAPGRPPGWAVADRAPKSARRGALKDPAVRRRLFLTFLHHELQAAELMAWAILAFPDTPRAFKRGLLAVCREELAHLALYRGYVEAGGGAVGDEPVRDWFWSRIPRAETPADFVATMAIGLEGGNLDHADRFAGWFDEAGDPAGAAILRRVRDDEVGHVRFGVRWFKEFTGGLDFAAWRDHLTPPLTPHVMRGRPLNTAGRGRAGLSPGFLAELARW